MRINKYISAFAVGALMVGVTSCSDYLLPLHPGIKLGYLVNGC